MSLDASGFSELRKTPTIIYTNKKVRLVAKGFHQQHDFNFT